MTPSQLDGQLRFAIAEKRLIAIEYQGRRRVVEPHDYGSMKGRTRLLVYQRSAGGSSDSSKRSRRATGWRLLDVQKIAACEVSTRTFAGSRGSAHSQHMSWDAVFARVQ